MVFELGLTWLGQCTEADQDWKQAEGYGESLMAAKPALSTFRNNQEMFFNSIIQEWLRFIQPVSPFNEKNHQPS